MSKGTKECGELLSTITNEFAIEHPIAIYFNQHIYCSGTTGIQIYNVSSKVPKYITNIHLSQPISAMRMIRIQEKSQIWVGTDLGKIFIFSINGKLIHEVNGHIGKVACILQAGGKVWTSSTDSQIRIWDIGTMQPFRKLVDHQGGVNAMALVENYIWSGGNDDSILLWDAHQGYLMDEIVNTSPVNHIVYFDGCVWTSHQNGSIKIWNVETKKCVKQMQAHKDVILGMCVTTSQIWTSSKDRVMLIYDAKLQKLLKKIRGNTTSVLAIECMDPETTEKGKAKNGRIFAMCSDKKIRIWRCSGVPKKFLLKDINLYDPNSSGSDTFSDDEKAELLQEEVFSLTRKLQIANARAEKYKSKLRHKKIRLEEQKAITNGIQMKYNHIQEELYKTRGELEVLEDTLQQLRKGKSFSKLENGTQSEIISVLSKIPQKDLNKEMLNSELSNSLNYVNSLLEEMKKVKIAYDQILDELKMKDKQIITLQNIIIDSKKGDKTEYSSLVDLICKYSQNLYLQEKEIQQLKSKFEKSKLILAELCGKLKIESTNLDLIEILNAINKKI